MSDETEARGPKPALDPAVDEVHAKMREALARKHERERSGDAHLDGHGLAGEPHGKPGVGREYRRKSMP